MRRVVTRGCVSTGQIRDDKLMRKLSDETAMSMLWVLALALQYMRRAGSALRADEKKLWLGRVELPLDRRRAFDEEKWQERALEAELAGRPLPPRPRPQTKKRCHCPKELAEGLAAEVNRTPHTVRLWLDLFAAGGILNVRQGPEDDPEAKVSRRRRDGRKTYATWFLLFRPPARLLARLRHGWGEISNAELARLLGAASPEERGDPERLRAELHAARRRVGAPPPPDD